MSKLSKNIIYNFVGQGLLVILSFVAVKYIFKQLGEDALGILYFALILSAAVSAALEMGIGSTTVREVSAHFQSDPSYIRDLIRTGSFFFWSLYGLLALGIYWCSPLLVHRWINLRSLDSGSAIHALRVLGIASMVALPRSLYVSILRGLQRMEFNNFVDVATLGLQQFGTIVILVLGGKLIHVAYWFAACFGLGILAYLSISARFLSFKALVPGYSSSVVRRNLGYTSAAAAISVLATIQSQADKVIVSKLLPIGVLGYYGLAYSAVSRSTLVSAAISQAAFPSFSAQFRAGDRDNMLSQYRKLQDLLCFGIVPIFAAFPFVTVPLFTYVLNAQAARMLLLPTTFLSLGFYMNGTLTIPYVFSLAAGKPEIAARSNFYALFCVLPVTVALVYFFGLSGAGFSLVLYYCFAYVYAVPRICSECLEITAWKWYVELLRIVVLCGLTYGVAWIILDASSNSSFALSVLAYGLASVLFFFAAYLSIGTELRQSFNGLHTLLEGKSAAGS